MKARIEIDTYNSSWSHEVERDEIHVGASSTSVSQVIDVLDEAYREMRSALSSLVDSPLPKAHD